MIYLEQPFYELIFESCADSVDFPVLGRVISLTYEDELVIDGDQLKDLQFDLRKVLDRPSVHHEQASAFIKIAGRAEESGLGLAIDGDMYPVLRR